jgi:coenzyme PQQ precursor peptide PqqA
MAQRLGALQCRPQHSAWDNVSPRRPPGHCATRQETHPMQWSTPTAVDFRFGFEITMYVSNR